MVVTQKRKPKTRFDDFDDDSDDWW